jgi:hypothetical protein
MIENVAQTAEQLEAHILRYSESLGHGQVPLKGVLISNEDRHPNSPARIQAGIADWHAAS